MLEFDFFDEFIPLFQTAVYNFFELIFFFSRNGQVLIPIFLQINAPALFLYE